MSTLIISSFAPFGQMTNATVSRLIALNATVDRLNDAIATASSGFEGTPGTQFESASGSAPGVASNLFGVQPDPDNPGARGTDYSYAMGRLAEEWAKFWEAAGPSIAALDNGQPAT